MRNKRLFIRWGLYLFGMVVLSLGLFWNARSGLGTSPMLSITYVGTQVWDIRFGDASLIAYCVYVFAQFFVRGKQRRWQDLLQLPAGLLVSQLLNLFAVWFPFEAADHTFFTNLVVLLCALPLTGIGTAVTVNMKLLPSPADGFVQALAERFGKEQGVMKNIVDIISVILAVVLSLTLCGRLEGVGIGTLLAMLGVGRVISLVNRLFRNKMMAAAGLLDMAVQEG